MDDLFNKSSSDTPSFSEMVDFQGTLNRNINDILSLLESPKVNTPKKSKDGLDENNKNNSQILKGMIDVTGISTSQVVSYSRSLYIYIYF